MTPQSAVPGQYRTAPALYYPLIGVALTLVLFAVLAMSPPAVYVPLTKEGSPIEVLSAVLYFVAAALLVRVARDQWPYLIILVFFGLRELDMDKLPFTEGLFKSRQYIGDTVPAIERILTAIVLALLLVVVILSIKRGLAALRARGIDGVTLSVLAALALGSSAKLLDGLGRKLAPYGIEVTKATEEFAILYEEVAELGMAFCLTLACVAYLRSRPAQGGIA